MANSESGPMLESVAVIGMAARVPGANNVREFWQNLRNGVESISQATDEQLAAAGVDVAAVRAASNYVRARGRIQDPELFDAGFFNIPPREAELMDPQHRLFLETAWQALEDAGYDPANYPNPVGVYGGVSKNTYLINNIYPGRENNDSAVMDQTDLANEKDYLATRVCYKLNLKGPGVSVNTACSTSLVAIYHAYQSLLTYQCDMALAGGVCLQSPQGRGYYYYETAIMSPDGHCRSYDARAQGTVGGNGVGIVVLKRLADALADGDHIYAVIRGMGLNNDGSAKLSYTAPSVNGQSEVIALAQAIAGVDPDTITYVEGHGTATPLGDPIEVAALTQAFRLGTDRKNFCALGTVKPNVGHLDIAAGVTGFIKASLAIQQGEIPPTLHFQQPNPELDLDNSPFYINNQLLPWQPAGIPRRAGVSAFGIGGTNVHAVLEQAPAQEPTSASRTWQLLPVSARSEAALDQATIRLTEHLKQNGAQPLPDVAYTLQLGRRHFDHRRFMVVKDAPDAIAGFGSLDPRRVITQRRGRANPAVCFMFPGGGAQYVNMGRDLYREEPLFREQVDRCLGILRQKLNLDLMPLIYPADDDIDTVKQTLEKPSMALPALFTIEYATARLWQSWGVQPQALVGHSMGEYTAACLSGVFSLETALELVSLRGRLFEQLPEGAMLGVPLSEEQVKPYLSERLSIAAINRPTQCTASGPVEDVDALQKTLHDQGIDSTRVLISVAAHSSMVDAITVEFGQFLQSVKLNPPTIPILSNLSGGWLSAAEATNPDYWVQHLRRTVRFSDSLQTLFEEPGRLLLEVGPGQTLSTLVRQHPARQEQHQVLSSLRHPGNRRTTWPSCSTPWAGSGRPEYP